jgi:hypothetical protein
MPVRPRRSRRARHALTMERDIALRIGPSPFGGSESDDDVLYPVWLEHRHRFGPDDWGTRRFEHGVDDRAELVPVQENGGPPGG